MYACKLIYVCLPAGVRLYYQEAGEAIPSYLMLHASHQIEPRSLATSPTLAQWCQSANNNSNNGLWLQPSGKSLHKKKKSS